MKRHATLKLFHLSMIVFLLLGGLSQATVQVQARSAPALPLGFSTEAVVSDLPSPTTVAWAPDGRMFIGQKDGRVRVVLNPTSSSPTLLATDFIDISSEVNDYWDRGLLGIAVHPNFPTQPYVYLLYVYDPPPAAQDGSGQRVARLTRVTADKNQGYNVAVPGSEIVLLGKNSTYANIANPDLVNGKNGQPSCDIGGVPVQDCLPTDSPSHSVGTVTFAPDGSLFASIGEGAQFSYTDFRALRAQNIDALSGKIFRINPDTGQGYPDNPFYDGDLDHNRSKVWDYGMRNPFRFTIRPNSGNEAYIGDVGWNTWEELNVGKGKNFGWPCYEGNNQGSAVQPSYSSNISTENFCASLYSGGGFPATPVLDSFDRPDGGIGSKWTGATGGYLVASNLLTVGSGGDVFRGVQYGPNQEAFLLFTTIDPNATELGVLLKSASKTASTSGALKVIYDPTNQRVQVWTYTSGQGWTQRGANLPVTFANGDVLGARALADGSVRLYRNGTLLGTIDVTAWPQFAAGGYIGLTATNAGSAVYNDFGGGTTVLVYPAALKAPVWAYDHSSGDASIQANVFYTGSVYPAQYQGALFIEDYSRNWIKYVTFDAGGAATVHDFADAVAIVGGPVHMSQGPDGLLYYVAYNGTTASEIRRIRYTAGNSPPTAFASANPTSGISPLAVAFSSAGSSDPESQPITFSWNFDDGSTSTDPNPSHTFSAPANTIKKFNVVLTVTDSQGASNTASVQITVGDTAPVPHIATPAQGTKYNVGDSINFSGSATDVEDGTLPGSSLQWSVLLHHHTHVHFDYFSASGTSGSFIAPDHGDDTFMELCLTATDKNGLNGKTCINLYPNTVVYTFQSVPSGLQLVWEGIAYATPFTVTTIVNAQEQLIAPPTQSGWKYSHWSDGGDQTHTITIQATPQTFTAFYSAPYNLWMPLAAKY